MNILTFDIEEWFNFDNITRDYHWENTPSRIDEGVERILAELEKRGQKATCFCLGWIADKHPHIIKAIHAQGHHIGCHSYKHELSTRFDRGGFKQDTDKAKKLIEDLIGEEINAFRAPGFSITENNTWALEVLAELGFQYDCSLFPAAHDYGGYISYGEAEPAILQLANGAQIKEFPMNILQLFGKNIVFSGGGFFRLFPYFLIKRWAKQSPYMMSYFHPQDFDPGIPMIETLPPMRKFKSYVGLKQSFGKFQHLLDDFDFVNLPEADMQTDWETIRKINI
ncbi:polysaccharide deacetylase [Bacteroidia bacterium]|nr:polysaccharide deacetylase [Bacteroidia bacterium]